MAEGRRSDTGCAADVPSEAEHQTQRDSEVGELSHVSPTLAGISCSRLGSALKDVGYLLQQHSKLLQSVQKGLEASPFSTSSSQRSAGRSFSLQTAVARPAWIPPVSISVLEDSAVGGIYLGSGGETDAVGWACAST